MELTPSKIYGAVSWHVRGLLATEANRRVAFKARELWQPAEIEARRGAARDLASELLPELEIDRAAGYRMLDRQWLPCIDEVCAIGKDVVSHAELSQGVANGEKQFSRIRLAREQQRLTLIRIGLDRRLLAMAAAYLGVLPVISEADFFCSFATSGPFTKSQLWHCDDDAGDVLKIFIYCDDVAPANGPFELIEPEASRRARAAVGYRFAGRRYRVADAAMERHVPPSQVISLCGPAGTAFVVNTVHCFHRGSRITEPGKRRVAGVVCYCPPSGQTLPRRLAGGRAPLIDFAPYFDDPIARAALGQPLATRWL